MSEAEFEGRVGRALHAPVRTSARAKQAIMEGVRKAARDGMPHRFPMSPGRSARHSIIGVALAAGIGSITTLSAVLPSAGPAQSSGLVSSAVIGDSVVDRVRDTMRLVRLIFHDSSARQVAVIGDFNGWRSDANRMRRDEHSGKWTVTLALHDGDHRYAIVVDNTRQAADGAAAAVDASGQVYSLLHVARASN